LPTPGKCDRRLVDPAGDPTEQRIAATWCIRSEGNDNKKTDTKWKIIVARASCDST